MKLRALIFIAMTCAIATGDFARGAEDETFGDKLKKFFAGPTPKPRKKRKPSVSPRNSPTPTPSPSATASVSPSISSAPANAASASPGIANTPAASQAPVSPTPTASPQPTAAVSATPSATPYPAQSPRSRPHAPIIEPVRPISPGPRSRRRMPTPPPEVPTPSPVEQRPTPLAKVPPPISTPASAAQTAATPAAKATPATPPSPAPVAKRKPTAPATIPPTEITGYETYSPNVRKVLDLSLDLTTRNLDYKYGSADPKNGGMDCSGFIHYVLSQSGVKNAPRDAREQYIWVRKAGTFQAVLAHRDDTFELDALKPGDLLFWAGAYSVDPDPAITHTMIYLGREKRTNQRIMVGASDGRTYKGQQKLGVSVFDFKVSAPKGKSEDKPAPVFVGYGRIPDLPNQ